MDVADDGMIVHHAAMALAPAADARDLILHIIDSGSSDPRDVVRMQECVAAIDAAASDPCVIQSGLPFDNITNARASAAAWLAARNGDNQ